MELLAERFGVSIPAVRQWLKHEGLPTPATVHGSRSRVPADKPGALATYSLQWVVSAYLDDLRTLADIGAEMGVTRERVRQILAKEGITGKDREPVHRRGRLADADLLRSLVALHWSINAIAARCESTPALVQTRLRELGVEAPVQRPKPCPVAAAQLRHLYEDDDLSIVEVGRHFGVSPLVARRWLLEAGIVLARRRIDDAAAAQLRTDGWTFDQIAAHLGCSSRHVRRILDTTIDDLAGHVDEIRVLLDEPGVTLADVAEAFGAHSEDVRAVCIEHQVPFPVLEVSDDEILAAVTVSAGLQGLAAESGQPRHRLYLRARELGVVPSAAQQARRDVRRAELARLAAAGMSVRELAARFDLDEATVRQNLRALGKPSSAGTWAFRRAAQQRRVAEGLPGRPSDDDVLAALASGMSRVQVFETLGVGYPRLWRLQAVLDNSAQ